MHVYVRLEGGEIGVDPRVEFYAEYLLGPVPSADKEAEELVRAGELPGRSSRAWRALITGCVTAMPRRESRRRRSSAARERAA